MEAEESSDSLPGSIASSSDLSTNSRRSYCYDRCCEWEEFPSSSWRSTTGHLSDILWRSNSTTKKRPLDFLAKELQELSTTRDAVLTKFDLEMNKGTLDKDQIDQVRAWLLRIDQTTALVNRFDYSSIQKREILIMFPWRKKRGLLKLQRSINGLKGHGEQLLHGFDVTPRFVPIRAMQPSTKIAEHEGFLSVIRTLVGDPHTNIIGVHGRSGADTTGILQEFHDELAERSEIDFDVVIWVTVSYNVHSVVARIQREILQRLNTSSPELGYHSEKKCASILRTWLSKMRFLMILDDLRVVLDLKKIGIPVTERGKESKIVMASCSREILESMGAEGVVDVRSRKTVLRTRHAAHRSKFDLSLLMQIQRLS